MANAERWVPLESNPEVISKYLWSIGMSKKWQFVDVFGLDVELLCMIPQPVCALVLLFPCSDKYYHYKVEEENRIEKNGQTISSNLYYTKQTVGNACGTVALIHCIANNREFVEIGDGFLKTFIESTNSLTPEEKAAKLESDESMMEAHENFAQEGQTEAPSRDERVNLHFVSLVEKDGHLYELDGRKQYPINHGETSRDSFLHDAAKICKEYMARDPKNLRFTVLALAAND